MDDSARHINQVQDHGSNPAAVCFLSVRRLHGDIALPEAFLTTKPQQIVAQHSQKKDQSIALEILAGKPLHIHIRFQLGMELLTGSVIVIQIDHFIRLDFQADPVRVNLDLREKKCLALDNGPFGCFVADRNGQKGSVQIGGCYPPPLFFPYTAWNGCSIFFGCGSFRTVKQEVFQFIRIFFNLLFTF